VTRPWSTYSIDVARSRVPGCCPDSKLRDCCRLKFVPSSRRVYRAVVRSYALLRQCDGLIELIAWANESGCRDASSNLPPLARAFHLHTTALTTHTRKSHAFESRSPPRAPRIPYAPRHVNMTARVNKSQPNAIPGNWPLFSFFIAPENKIETRRFGKNRDHSTVIGRATPASSRLRSSWSQRATISCFSASSRSCERKLVDDIPPTPNARNHDNHARTHTTHAHTKRVHLTSHLRFTNPGTNSRYRLRENDPAPTSTRCPPPCSVAPLDVHMWPRRNWDTLAHTSLPLSLSLSLSLSLFHPLAESVSLSLLENQNNARHARVTTARRGEGMVNDIS